MCRMNNKKIGSVLAMGSFILMLSIYQSYMGFAVGLIVMLKIKTLLTEKNSAVKVIKNLFIKAGILIVGAIAYYLLTIIILKVNNLTMSSYQGMNQISLFSIVGSLFSSIKTAYIGFIKYFFADGVVLNRTWKRDKLYLFFFALYAISMVLLFIKLYKEEKSKEVLVRILLACIFVGVLPIALNLVMIMAPGNQIYYLISTQMILMIPFVFTIFEMLETKKIFVNILNWGIVIITTTIMITYIFSIIITYQTVDISYNQAKSISNRVLYRMEEYPGYRSGMNKLFAGVIDDKNFPKTLDTYNYAICNSLRASIFHGTYWGQEATWQNFMNLFCGTHITFCPDNEYYIIINSDEFKQMDIFPGQNSVKIINDVMVVKFTEFPAGVPLSQD